MPVSELYNRIRAEIDMIAIVDTHEHLIHESIRLGQDIDLFHWFLHYASSDLVSAGMSVATLERLRDTALPLEDRWAEFAPFWRDIRTTGYGRVLLIAARDLFGIDDISEHSYRDLSRQIGESNHSGWYQHVLKDLSNIEISILHPLEKWDPTPLEEVDSRYFLPVLCVDDVIRLCDRVGLQALEVRTGMSIHSLRDLLSALDIIFERAVAAGVVGVKVAVAYERTIQFEKVSQADAERVFNCLGCYPAIGSTDFTPQPPLSWAEAKPLQDYLVHEVIRRAIAYGLPIQIHTGILEGNGNFLTNSHPLNLVNILNEYREARFDLFHAGYPYQSEMATLGKSFPNVYVDLCWLHVLTPWVARQTLHEWIEMVPSNKIFAFGGDYGFVEGVYGHARMARSNVAEVLTEKVESRYITEDEALGLAHKILRDNAIRFFQLAL